MSKDVKKLYDWSIRRHRIAVVVVCQESIIDTKVLAFLVYSGLLQSTPSTELLVAKENIYQQKKKAGKLLGRKTRLVN